MNALVLRVYQRISQKLRRNVFVCIYSAFQWTASCCCLLVANCCTFVCIAEYQAKLDALHEPMPERAMYAPADEGAGKPHCFTNYEPHFNPAQRLDSVLLGAHEGWNLVQMATWSESERLFGYKDTKPFYEVRLYWC